MYCTIQTSIKKLFFYSTHLIHSLNLSRIRVHEFKLIIKMMIMDVFFLRSLDTLYYRRHDITLWWGVRDKEKIHRVKWRNIYNIKKNCNLTIEELNLFNVEFHNKWKWCRANDGEAIWRELMDLRYASIKSKFLGREELKIWQKDSIWWQNILFLENM